MQKISGIGGFFFRAKDPKKLSTWYEKNFGINSINSTEVWIQQSGPTVFVPVPEDTDSFEKQQSMLNFRVNNLGAMLKQLEKNNVKIDERREEESIGKFASVYDPEGNKIELWEPSDDSHWKDKEPERVDKK